MERMPTTSLPQIRPPGVHFLRRAEGSRGPEVPVLVPSSTALEPANKTLLPSNIHTTKRKEFRFLTPAGAFPPIIRRASGRKSTEGPKRGIFIWAVVIPGPVPAPAFSAPFPLAGAGAELALKRRAPTRELETRFISVGKPLTTPGSWLGCSRLL